LFWFEQQVKTPCLGLACSTSPRQTEKGRLGPGSDMTRHRTTMPTLGHSDRDERAPFHHTTVVCVVEIKEVKNH